MKNLLLAVIFTFCLAALAYPQNATRAAVTADFNGDGKSDIAVWRPSNGFWYIMSPSGGYSAVQWGASTDKPMPGDYDGDGKIDPAVVRTPPFDPRILRNYTWYVLNSSSNSYTTKQWGSVGFGGGDLPLPADYDGDGKTDLSVYTWDGTGRGQGSFRPLYSTTGSSANVNWGFTGDKRVAADFDGDGKTDFAVFQDASSYRPDFDLSPLPTWYILQSSNGAVKIEHFGMATDKLVPADYDGDGKADVAVWRPSNGYWYRLNSKDGSLSAIQFGQDGDKPVPADYDGDGKTDIAVFRPSQGMWYLLKSSEGFSAIQFGFGDDIPIPNVFVQ